MRTRGKVRLIMRDPLFSVIVDPRAHGGTVRVQLGYVEVRRAREAVAPSSSGPVQQVEVPNGGRPAEVTPIVLTAQDDNDRIQAKLTARPRAGLLTAGRDESLRGLEAIYKSGVLRVVLYQSDADTATANFVRAFFEFLAKSWKLKLTFLTAITSADISKGLNVTFDIAAVHDPGLVKELPHVPMLTDPSRAFRGSRFHGADPFSRCSADRVRRGRRHERPTTAASTAPSTPAPSRTTPSCGRSSSADERAGRRGGSTVRACPGGGSASFFSHRVEAAARPVNGRVTVG